MVILIRVSIILAWLTGLVLAQDVSFNFDTSADFSKYHTYRWEKNPKSLDVDDLTLGQLGKGFDAALSAKGLKRVDSGDTDLVIVFQIATGQEKQMTTFDSGGYGYGPGWRGGWYGGYGGGMSTTTTSTIHTGAVVLDMYDIKSKSGLARNGVEDPRPEGQAGEASEEHR